MKKTLLLTLVVFAGLAVFSQAVRVKPGFTESKAPNRNFTETGLSTSIPAELPVEYRVLKSEETGIILRELSTSANGFGFLGSRQTIWANDDINTVTFTHRMNIPPNGPGSGYIAFDYSTNRGEPGQLIPKFTVQLVEPLSTAAIRWERFTILPEIPIPTMLTRLISHLFWMEAMAEHGEATDMEL